MSRLVAIFFGVGLLKPAAGTWGSAAAILLGMVMLRYLGFPALALATAAATALGFWACQAELKHRPGADPGEFVIDEVAGQWLTLMFPAAAFWWRGMDTHGVFSAGVEGWLPWPAWVFAFLMFRLFDIWKPWIIGRADRRDDPAGVMLDDLWAGVFAGVTSLILAALYHIPLVLMQQ
jgi:phosphatidylglycerophosphatase A